MQEHQMFERLLDLCEDLQDQTYLRDVIYDYQKLRSSCDLLLRNMMMILQLEITKQPLNTEVSYIQDNLVTVFHHLTSRDIEDIKKEYNL